MNLATPDWGLSDDDLAAWNRAATCTHAGFHALDNPRRPMQECPDCGAVLRSSTDAEGWVDLAAENQQTERAYEQAMRDDRREGAA